MRHRPNHTCFKECPGCSYELGFQDATRKPRENAKFVWMVVGSNNPCDIRRYSFSHEEGVGQLAHTKGKFKDKFSGGEWKLFKLVPVNRIKTKKK